jgi:soluble lytic murein transglycosylase-like protein
VALKSVLDIDVNDAKFQRFKELFDKYNEQLGKQPRMWGDVGTKQREIAGYFEKMTAALLAHSQLTREASAAGDDQAAKLTRAEGLWTSIVNSSRSVLGNVTSTAEGLLKWTGILGMIGGLLGLGGGIFGIDRLATSVADKRRRQMGYGRGTTIGEVSAFDAAFGRLIDTQGFLGNLNAMETDVTQQTAAFTLLGHGLSGNTGADALSMLTAARGLAGRTQTNLLGPMFGAYGLNFSPDEMRRLQGSPAEFQQLVQQYQNTKGPMDIQEKIAKGWQDLVTQWEVATKEIGAILADRLAPLQGPLTRMSEALVEAAKNLPDFGKAVTTLGGWLDWLSRKIAHIDEVIKDVKGAVTHPVDYLLGGLNRPSDVAEHALLDFLPGAGAAGKSLKGYMGYLGELDKQFRFPAGTLEFIKQRESGGGMDPKILGPKTASGQQAVGLMQLMPGTAAHYGVDPTDPVGSAQGGADKLRDALKKYHGDMRKALAAYNGAANLDDIISMANQFGDDWVRYTKPETQKYIKAYDQAVAAGRIIVEDRTGGNVVITVAGLGAPSP